MVMLGIVRCKNGVNYHRDYELSGEINHTNNPCALKQKTLTQLKVVLGVECLTGGIWDFCNRFGKVAHKALKEIVKVKKKLKTNNSYYICVRNSTFLHK